MEQAESELMDKAKREELDATVKEARNIVLRSLNLPVSTPDDSSALYSLKPPLKARVRTQVKEMLIDEEVRRRKYVFSPHC